MSRKKKRITPFKEFESVEENATSYIRMVGIQLKCMNELSANAFRLYIMMKDYAKGNSEFNFPHRIYKEFMSNQTFITARNELVEKGYLETFVSQKSRQQENTYKFSSSWKLHNKIIIDKITNKNI